MLLAALNLRNSIWKCTYTRYMHVIYVYIHIYIYVICHIYIYICVIYSILYMSYIYFDMSRNFWSGDLSCPTLSSAVGSALPRMTKSGSKRLEANEFPLWGINKVSVITVCVVNVYFYSLLCWQITYVPLRTCVYYYNVQVLNYLFFLSLQARNIGTSELAAIKIVKLDPGLSHLAQRSLRCLFGRPQI